MIKEIFVFIFGLIMCFIAVGILNWLLPLGEKCN